MKLTVTEIAQKYGVTPSGVRYLIKTGKIPCETVGRLHLIDPADVPEHWKRGEKGRWKAEKIAGKRGGDEE